MLRFLVIILILSHSLFVYADECEKFVEAETETVQEVQAPSRGYFQHVRDHKWAYLVSGATWGAAMFVTSKLGSDQITLLMGGLVVLVGAPIFEQIRSKLRHFIFSPHKRVLAQREPELNNQWLDTQATYSVNAQMARHIHLKEIEFIQIIFPPQLILLLDESPELAQDLIVDKLIELSYYMSIYLEDIPHDNVEMARAVYMAIVKHLKDPEAVLNQALFQAEPGFEGDEARLTFWLKTYLENY